MEQAIGDINLEMLKELSEAHGISGNEKEVSRMMKKWMSPYADEITYDNLGSIIGLQKGEEDRTQCGVPRRARLRVHFQRTCDADAGVSGHRYHCCLRVFDLCQQLY